MGPRVILLVLVVFALLVAGCGNKEAEQAAAEQPKPGSIQAQVQQSRPSSAVDTDAVPAPAGVRTDLKGGLK